MTHLSLFSGIGGLDIAAEWAGFTTVACVEKDEFCRDVLEEQFPDAVIYGDIRRFTFDNLRARIGIDQVDLLTGGFPCQPFSVAGRRRGSDDDRYLWPEMLRVIRESQPTWICGENVAHLVNMVEFESLCADLENEGYEVQPIIIPACGVGAPHLRQRIFIVAYSEHRGQQARRTAERWSSRASLNGLRGSGGGTSLADADRQRKHSAAEGGDASRNRAADRSSDVVNANSLGLEERHGAVAHDTQRISQPKYADQAKRDWRQWEVEPSVGRVANGIPYRVDSLRTLGNAVVPQQPYPILKSIADQIMIDHS